MDTVSIDIKQPCDTRKPESSFTKFADQKIEKLKLVWDVPKKTRSEQSKDSAYEHKVNSEPCDDNSVLSLLMGHLRSLFRITFESIASKPGGEIVLKTADSGLFVAERVSFWIQDSSSLKCVPWLVMLPFLISARVANSFLSVTERITGLPMPTQMRVINTIRTLRNDICVIRKIGMKKVKIDEQDTEMDNVPTTAEDKKLQMENNTTSDEEEGACAMVVEETYSQISDQTGLYSSTLEESSDCDSELGLKIESILSTMSTTLDDSYASF